MTESRDLPSVTIDGHRDCRFLVLNPGLERRGATEDDIIALLAALPVEQAQRMIAELCKRGASFAGMVDAAADAEASKVLDMTDEELDAAVRADGEDPERLHRWGKATARWIAMVADLQQALSKEREARVRAERERDAWKETAKYRTPEMDESCECGVTWGHHSASWPFDIPEKCRGFRVALIVKGGGGNV